MLVVPLLPWATSYFHILLSYPPNFHQHLSNFEIHLSSFNSPVIIGFSAHLLVMKIAVKVVIVTEGEDFNMMRLFLTEIFVEESVQICSTGEYILKMFFVLL